MLLHYQWWFFIHLDNHPIASQIQFVANLEWMTPSTNNYPAGKFMHWMDSKEKVRCCTSFRAGELKTDIEFAAFMYYKHQATGFHVLYFSALHTSCCCYVRTRYMCELPVWSFINVSVDSNSLSQAWDQTLCPKQGIKLFRKSGFELCCCGHRL